jgi:hypothetical protein
MGEAPNRGLFLMRCPTSLMGGANARWRNASAFLKKRVLPRADLTTRL